MIQETPIQEKHSRNLQIMPSWKQVSWNKCSLGHRSMKLQIPHGDTPVFCFTSAETGFGGRDTMVLDKTLLGMLSKQNGMPQIYIQPHILRPEKQYISHVNMAVGSDYNNTATNTRRNPQYANTMRTLMLASHSCNDVRLCAKLVHAASCTRLNGRIKPNAAPHVAERTRFHPHTTPHSTQHLR